MSLGEISTEEKVSLFGSYIVERVKGDTVAAVVAAVVAAEGVLKGSRYDSVLLVEEGGVGKGRQEKGSIVD